MGARRTIKPNAEQVKKAIAKRIKQILKDRELTQTAASYICQEAPSQLSLICTGKLRGFSLERLVSTLARLGEAVEIRSYVQTSKRTGRISYVAA